MTFRGRLVLVAAIAVVVAVLGAAATSYFAARDSLIGSLDGTLQLTANKTLTTNRRFLRPPTTSAGLDYQFIASTGTLLGGRSPIPVTNHAERVAAGNQSSYFTSITISGIPYREYVTSAPPIELTRYGVPTAVQHTALLLVLPMSSVNSQLTRLGYVLAGVAALGVALALVLAWAVGRTALVPLDDLTSAVERVAATSDVTQRLDPGGPDELGTLRRAFNDLLSALQRSQDAQRQLVLDAGHELRTPLTSLRTNLEVVERLDQLSPEERRVLVDDLLTQMSELTTLVANLSELARGDQRPSEPRVLRFDRVVEDAVSLATTHGRPRNVSFALSSAPTWVRGHRDRLDRAVGNLLDNALKWSPDDSVVEVACRDGVLTVRDHGPGIAAEDLPHVFDRFYRAPSARAMPGSGLGLAIVAQVAHAEGGGAWAAAAPGGGALFTLGFPAVAPPPASERTGADDADDADDE